MQINSLAFRIIVAGNGIFQYLGHEPSPITYKSCSFYSFIEKGDKSLCGNRIPFVARMTITSVPSWILGPVRLAIFSQNVVEIEDYYIIEIVSAEPSRLHVFEPVVKLPCPQPFSINIISSPKSFSQWPL